MTAWLCSVQSKLLFITKKYSLFLLNSLLVLLAKSPELFWIFSIYLLNMTRYAIILIFAIYIYFMVILFTSVFFYKKHYNLAISSFIQTCSTDNFEYFIFLLYLEYSWYFLDFVKDFVLVLIRILLVLDTNQ